MSNDTERTEPKTNAQQLARCTRTGPGVPRGGRGRARLRSLLARARGSGASLRAGPAG